MPSLYLIDLSIRSLKAEQQTDEATDRILQNGAAKKVIFAGPGTDKSLLAKSLVKVFGSGMYGIH